MIGLRFFPLKSADVRGAGTRDEPLRTSAWKVIDPTALNNFLLFFQVPLSACQLAMRADPPLCSLENRVIPQNSPPPQSTNNDRSLRMHGC